MKATQITRNRTIILGLVFSLISLISLMGCNEKPEVIIYRIHATTGAALIGSHDAIVDAHKKGLIDDSVYTQMKVNWERARRVYVDTEPIVESLIEHYSEDGYIKYLGMINQVNVIANDILEWVNSK